MDQSRAVLGAQWQVTIGWVTTIGLSVARASTVVTQVAAGSPDPLVLGQAVLKTVILLTCVVLYRTRLWPSLLLFAAWPIGFVFAWIVAKASAAVLLVGVVVGAGLYLGARGALALHALARATPPPG